MRHFHRLVPFSFLFFSSICPGAPVLGYGEDEPSWTEFGNLPAGRIEEFVPSYSFEAWQNLSFETDEPIEGLLMEFGGVVGPYAVQPLSHGGVSFTSLEEYESAWIEYMLAANARLSGDGVTATPAEPVSGGRTYSTQTVNPIMSLAEPVAEVPEISNGWAGILGAVLLGVGRAVRRRLTT